MTNTFNVIVEQGEDGYLISEVVGLPGCHTQAKTYDQLIERTKEAIKLYLKSTKSSEPLLKFVSLQQIEVGA
ncbi:type II toxin-antitoxin system HicB family antitoxin [Candidatus Woesearchaeota archaeon]|nr:type II toxin-antitoxin system HicB family antitoxin [Candidatus Woesearchaeota archaeon]